MRTRYTRSRSGFTLIELIAVISLLGLVMGIFILNLDTILGDSKEKLAQEAVDYVFPTPIMSYQLKHGKYPASLTELAPYLKGEAVPKDPWQNDYQYKAPGTRNAGKYDIWSMGPDGVNGTADDIGNW